MALTLLAAQLAAGRPLQLGQAGARLGDAASSQGSLRGLRQAEPQPLATAAASGGEVAGSYVVTYTPDAGDSTDRLLRFVLQQTTSPEEWATTDNGASLPPPFDFEYIGLPDNSTGADSPDTTDMAGAGDLGGTNDAGSSNAAATAPPGIVSIRINATRPEVVAAIRAFSGVRSMWADRVATATAATCVPAQRLSQGVTAQVTDVASFGWSQCLPANAKLVWVGERCGDDLALVNWTGVSAVDKTTGAQLTSGGVPCVLLPQPQRPTLTRWRFGLCGVAPDLAPSLPTCVAPGSTGEACAAPLAANATAPKVITVELSQPVKCGARRVSVFNYTRTPCGPGGQYVALTAASARGCKLKPSTVAKDIRKNMDMYGACGISPGLSVSVQPLVPCPAAPLDSPAPSRSPSPSPRPPSPSPQPWTPIPIDDLAPLPRVAVLAGEQVPAGLTHIEAAAGGGVADITGVPRGKQVVIGVVDSGVDATHQDVVYAGGLSWVPGDKHADRDGFGHGTHVAGTAAARNNGKGVVGVSPGTPVFSLKVLDDSGRGTLGRLLHAVKWVATEGVKQNVRVINLSVAAYVNPSSSNYQMIYDTVCAHMQEASDAGVIVVASAGNDAADLESYLPAACPSVVAVTALDGTGRAPAAWSNFLPAGQPPSERARVLAAPGTNILSAMAYEVDASGYRSMSGTSTAAPHVAGVAANCMMNGSCGDSLSGSEKAQVIQAGATWRAALSPLPKYVPPAAAAAGTQPWYGYMVSGAKY